MHKQEVSGLFCCPEGQWGQAAINTAYGFHYVGCKVYGRWKKFGGERQGVSWEGLVSKEDMIERIGR